MKRYIITTAYHRCPYEERIIRRYSLNFLTFDTLDAAYGWIMRAMESKPRYRVNHYWYEVEEVRE